MQPAYQIGDRARVRRTHGGLLYCEEIGTVRQVMDAGTHSYYMLIFAYEPPAVFRDDELEPVPHDHQT